VTLKGLSVLTVGQLQFGQSSVDMARNRASIDQLALPAIVVGTDHGGKRIRFYVMDPARIRPISVPATSLGAWRDLARIDDRNVRAVPRPRGRVVAQW
jgi:hypothetical protein